MYIHTRIIDLHRMSFKNHLLEVQVPSTRQWPSQSYEMQYLNHKEKSKLLCLKLIDVKSSRRIDRSIPESIKTIYYPSYVNLDLLN